MQVSGNPAIHELRQAHVHRAPLPTAIRTVLLTLTLIFGFSAFVRADEFWKQKPSAQWSHDEALRLLRHSPWAKVEAVMFRRTEVEASYSIATGKKHCDPDALDQNGNCLQRMKLEPPVDASQSRNGAPGLSPSTAFLVRWESAGPVSQAFVRLEELGEHPVVAFQAQAPRLPADRYVITVRVDHPGFAGFEPFAVLAGRSPNLRATLKTRRGSVAPVEVEFTGAGVSAAVHFYFPRSVDGAPLLGAGRDTAEFEMHGAGFAVHSKFTLDPEFLR
ncbi:MAG TPA: hypothetical protein VFI45_21930 [Candidatus Acidoferrum sp.]|nr:hypothetical protein [Candidatus Acidoferrum sp.]